MFKFTELCYNIFSKLYCSGNGGGRNCSKCRSDASKHTAELFKLTAAFFRCIACFFDLLCSAACFFGEIIQRIRIFAYCAFRIQHSRLIVVQIGLHFLIRGICRFNTFGYHALKCGFGGCNLILFLNKLLVQHGSLCRQCFGAVGIIRILSGNKLHFRCDFG